MDRNVSRHPLFFVLAKMKCICIYIYMSVVFSLSLCPPSDQGDGPDLIDSTVLTDWSDSARPFREITLNCNIQLKWTLSILLVSTNSLLISSIRQIQGSDPSKNHHVSVRPGLITSVLVLQRSNHFFGVAPLKGVNHGRLVLCYNSDSRLQGRWERCGVCSHETKAI